MPFPTAQGTTFEFAGVEYSCTNIKVAVSSAEGGGGGGGGNAQIDVSTLELAEGANRVFQDPPLRDPNTPQAVEDEDGNLITTTVTISFYGASKPPAGVTDTLTTSAASGSFKCTQSEVEYAVGDIVKGTATFVSAPAGS